MKGFQFSDGMIWIPVCQSSHLHRNTPGRKQNYAYTENCVKFCMKEKCENLLCQYSSEFCHFYSAFNNYIDVEQQSFISVQIYFSNAFSVPLDVLMACLEPCGRSFPPLLENTMPRFVLSEARSYQGTNFSFAPGKASFRHASCFSQNVLSALFCMLLSLACVLTLRAPAIFHFQYVSR